MVRFSINSGDKCNKTESPGLANKTGLAKRWVPKFSFFYKKRLPCEDFIREHRPKTFITLSGFWPLKGWGEEGWV